MLDIVRTLILTKQLFRGTLCYKLSCCSGALLFSQGQNVVYLVCSDLFLLML